MILLIDIGNSRIKWASSDGKMLQDGGSVAHVGNPANAVLSSGLPRAQSIWVSHVMGPQHEKKLAAAIKGKCGKAPQIARTRPEFAGLRVSYAQPQRLGVDRWLSMIALRARRREAFCVASAGTALTFDAVDAQGQHLGGVIAPGLMAMQSAVLGTTRFGVKAMSERYDDGLGRDTESCVRQGALHAAAGLVDRLAARHKGRRTLTGGDAEVLQPLLTTPWELRPQLVLEGLLALASAK